MELNRRNFIKFLVGGVAGIHATPLPWKLTDDIAIWTQNWPWVPVPPVGEFTEAASVCTLCPGGCGITLRRVDERGVKIEGRTDFPVNPGGICPVGMGVLQLVYDRDLRFPGPMKRVGPRGSGQFAVIGWDEALQILAGRMQALRANGTPQAVAALDGTREETTVSALLQRLLRAYGSPNHLRLPTLEETYALSTARMFGQAGPMAYDLENADYILSFGSGLLEGWGSPGRVLNAWGLWHPEPGKSTATIVQVESRASNTASKADLWIPVKPGAEITLALALAHVIIGEALYHREFVEAHCAGFGAFKDLVMKRFDPAGVAPAIGLSAERIVSLARAFARAGKPLALYGKGKSTLNGSLHESMAVLALNALVGNINQPGGILVQQPLPLKPLPDFEPDDAARRGLASGRLDRGLEADSLPAHTRWDRFAEAVGEDPGRGPIQLLVVLGGNPAYTLPGGLDVQEALKRIPFIVSFSPFRDETAYLADLILPDHVFLEKRDEIVWPVGLQYPLYGLSRPVVGPVYDTRHAGDVLLQLAARLGEGVKKAFPWTSFEEILAYRAQGLFQAGGGRVRFDPGHPVWEMQRSGAGGESDFDSFEQMWEQLLETGLWYRPRHAYRNWDRIFKTASGRFEFAADDLAKALAAAPEPAGGDLQLVPYDVINVAGYGVPSPPFVKKTLSDRQLLANDSFLELNPATAAKLGVREGDRVRVTTRAGRAQVRITLFEGAMPGVGYILRGLGHTAYDEFWQGNGVNADALIEPGLDPLSGHPAWWQCPAKIKKL